MWQPAWTKAYSAYFPFHVCAVAGDAASVPCLYSLALRSLFFWFQRVGEHTVYDPEWHPPLVSDFPVEYTRVRVSCVARDWLRWGSDHLHLPEKASGSRVVAKHSSQLPVLTMVLQSPLGVLLCSLQLVVCYHGLTGLATLCCTSLLAVLSCFWGVGLLLVSGVGLHLGWWFPQSAL